MTVARPSKPAPSTPLCPAGHLPLKGGDWQFRARHFFSSGGDWRKQKLSEQEYMKAFSTADERYSEVLTALLAQLKKTS